jgi:phage shock protein A
MDVTGAIPQVIMGDYGWRHGNYGNGYCNDSSRIDTDTILRGLSDIRMEQKESEADLLKQMCADAAVNAKNFGDTTFRLHENIRNVADQILASSNLTQAQVAQGFAAAALAAANNTSAIVLAGEKQTAAILAALSATELRQVQDQLNESRLKVSSLHSDINFGNQLSVIKSQINSLDQIQRSTNQAINFGNGRTGEQSSTSNQVR